MRIGVPSEIKSDEYRVAITPAGVRELASRGHEVLVQSGAGKASGFTSDHSTCPFGHLVNLPSVTWQFAVGGLASWALVEKAAPRNSGSVNADLKEILIASNIAPPLLVLRSILVRCGVIMMKYSKHEKFTSTTLHRRNKR